MGAKKYKWHKVATAAADIKLTSGDIAEVEVEGKKYCIGRFNEEWYGFAHTCPHAGASMMDAYVAGSCQVVCPVHHLKFNLKNGRDINGEGYTIKTYPVEVRPDGVYFGMEEAGGFFSKWF
ncbi:MAG: Rieske 2Fe-2S domain-containing protein [Bacteroidetes bacterium]|nr:Rieske 2Fe-2S domain-containing protein [Bacteroidota bacterium]